MKNIKILLIFFLLSTLLVSACSDKKKAVESGQSQNGVKYTCPMHPQIIEGHPGNCPICGMTLVKRAGQASENSGISLNTVLQPVNSSVISTINAISPVNKTITGQIAAQGYLDFDTRTFNNIAARFSGRIEKLYVKYAFQQIHRGQRIFDIYSPDMVTAQQDLLYLNIHSQQETGLVNAAKQKLLLMGMTPGQVSQLISNGKIFYSLPVYSPYEGHVHNMPHNQMTGFEQNKETSFDSNLPLSIKEGMYVEKGQNMFNVVDPHSLWAVIKINSADVASLKLNQAVKIALPDQPDIIIKGKVNFIEPALQNGDKNTNIRVYLHNMDHALKVNSLVTATIETGITSGLWIPKAALIDLGQTKIVWLKTGGSYKAQQVFPGSIDLQEVEIKKGLSVTDSVAANAQYLTDSESFIKTVPHEK